MRHTALYSQFDILMLIHDMILNHLIDILPYGYVSQIPNVYYHFQRSLFLPWKYLCVLIIISSLKGYNYKYLRMYLYVYTCVMWSCTCIGNSMLWMSVRMIIESQMLWLCLAKYQPPLCQSLPVSYTVRHHKSLDCILTSMCR